MEIGQKDNFDRNLPKQIKIITRIIYYYILQVTGYKLT